MVWKNKPNIVLYPGLLASAIFWLLDSVIDAVFFDRDETVFESIFSPSIHEIYMRAFALAFSETAKQAAKDFVEGLRVSIANEKFADIGQVTVRLGITGFYTGDTSDSIFNRADIALYAAKNAGRNCVVTA